MTTKLQDLVNCFVTDPKMDRANETITTANFNWSGQRGTLASFKQIKDQFDRIASDSWIFSVELDCSESPFTFTPQGESRWLELHEALTQAYCDSESINLSFSVSNRIVRGVIHLFDPEVFFEWISEQKVPDLLEQFSLALKSIDHIWFVHSSFEPAWGSETLAFVGLEGTPALAHRSTDERSELCMARREVVTSDWNCLLFPEDFRIAKGTGSPECCKAFARLENFLAIASLTDAVVKSDEENFLVRLIGHRMQEQKICWSGIPDTPNSSLQQIYDWVYRYKTAGPLADRLGLARNFISLHWTDSIFNLDPRVLPAIKSGYELYLTRNLKDYVEIRSKVTSFILEIEGKAVKSVENAVSNLEKNFYGIVTFVTSFLLIKVLQDKTFDGAFTEQTASLGYALGIISLLHAFYANSSVNAEMDRSEALYMDLRRQYSTFFAPIDFDKIFGGIGSDKQKPGSSAAMSSTREYVEKRMQGLIMVWVISVLIAAGIIFYNTAKAPRKSQKKEPNVPTSKVSPSAPVPSLVRTSPSAFTVVRPNVPASLRKSQLPVPTPVRWPYGGY